MFKKKSFIIYILIFFFTIFINELICLVLFEPLTKSSFNYKSLKKQRLERISFIKSKLESKINTSEETKGLYIFHPYVGYVGRPGAYQWGEGIYPFNEYGLVSTYGHAYPYKRKENEFVIAIIGGSVASLFAAMEEEGLNSFIRREIYPTFEKKIILIDLATGGYKEPEQLFQLQLAILMGFEFDAVINIDGFNELVLAKENIDFNIHPIFPSGLHMGMIGQIKGSGTDFETIKLLFEYYTLCQKEYSLLSTIQKNSVLRVSVFMNLLGYKWSMKNINELNIVQAKMKNTQKNINSALKGPPFKYAGDKYSYITKVWSRSSKMLYDFCKANNLLYIHILQPNQYVDGSKKLTDNEKKIAFDPKFKWGVTAREGYDYLISEGKVLKELGIPFYDLTQIFKDITEDIYIDVCCHFGKPGNDIMAQQIAEILAYEINLQ